MQTNFTPQEVAERNQLIVDLLSAANGKEVHLNDIAWFLQIDPEEIDCWMQQYGFGKWITGKKTFYWRGIARKNAHLESGFSK